MGIKEILTKEYKWENYLLAVLSLVAIVLGILIFTEVLIVSEGTIFENNPMLFAWVITIAGIVGLIISAIKLSKKD